jgi:transposase-like protein
LCNRPRISNFFKRIPSWVSKWTKTHSKLWLLSWPKTSSLKDLGTLTQQLIKLTVETALNAEMDEHLGYQKHAPQGRGTGNNRNGYSTKRLKGSTERSPSRRLVTATAPSSLSLSARSQSRRPDGRPDPRPLRQGLSTRDIVDAFKEMYDADISAALYRR